jgi:adenosine deaminase
MDYREFLRRLPKAELHIHFEGSVRPTTFFELARKHRLELPSEDPSTFYVYDTLVDFLKVYDIVCRSIRDQEDFARVAYETLEDGVRLGNLKYREMFFNPTTHTREGISWRTILDGILEGTRAAERDYGVKCRLIPAIHRGHTPAEAQEMVEAMLEARCDEIIGLGSDALPDDGTEGLQHFVGTYRYAKEMGLHVTAHCAETIGTEQNFNYALDVLECERIDHGYEVLRDNAMVERALDEGIWFTCCPSACAVALGWPDRANQPVRRMIELGLNVTLNSDDPPMFGTEIGREFVETCTAMKFGPDKAAELALNGVEGSWLDAGEKRAMRAEFEREIAELRSELEPS